MSFTFKQIEENLNSKELAVVLCLAQNHRPADFPKMAFDEWLSIIRHYQDKTSYSRVIAQALDRALALARQKPTWKRWLALSSCLKNQSEKTEALGNLARLARTFGQKVWIYSTQPNPRLKKELFGLAKTFEQWDALANLCWKNHGDRKTISRNLERLGSYELWLQAVNSSRRVSHQKSAYALEKLLVYFQENPTFSRALEIYCANHTDPGDTPIDDGNRNKIWIWMQKNGTMKDWGSAVWTDLDHYGNLQIKALHQLFSLLSIPSIGD
ncbi:MAG: hypothetical protein WCT37_03365 [Patescibacteria group bacterium]|jgi:hypothetical protein